MNSKQTKRLYRSENGLSTINPNDDGDVSLPYNGSSGWSGTDTSKERAKENDTYGKTAQVQAFVYRYLLWHQGNGGTWKEIADASGYHHGTVSGALSVLHKEGRIARLTERRDRCRVYVHPEYVNGRDTDQQGRKHECPECGHRF